jgi:PPOX class probable F420-dependent enzyme
MTGPHLVVDAAHLDELKNRKVVVMATIHPDGRPQLSLVRPWVHDGMIEVTLTERRFKTRNMRNDPRVALIAAHRDDQRFVVAEGHAALTDTTTAPGDETGQQLADLYRALAGEHPDWDDYYRAMVDDRRLIARITIDHTYSAGIHT